MASYILDGVGKTFDASDADAARKKAADLLSELGIDSGTLSGPSGQRWMLAYEGFLQGLSGWTYRTESDTVPKKVYRSLPHPRNALSDEDMYPFAALTALRACSYRVTVKAVGENKSLKTLTELFMSPKTKSAILQFLPYARLHFGGNALDKYLTAEQMLEEVCSFLCKNEAGEQDDEEEAPPEEGFDEEWLRSMQEDAPPAFCEDEEDEEYQGDEESDEDEEGEEDEEEIPDDDVDLSEPQESGERIEMFRRRFLSKMLRIKMEADNKFRLEGDKLCSYCGKEKQVTIGGIRQIAAGAFLNLLELEEISMDDTVELIETGAIFGCPKLAKITYNGTKEQWQRVEKQELWHDREKLEICCSDGKLIG